MPMVTAVTVHGSVRLVNGLLARSKVVIFRLGRVFSLAEQDCLASLKKAYTALSNPRNRAGSEQVALYVTRMDRSSVSESEVRPGERIVTGVLEVRDLQSPLWSADRRRSGFVRYALLGRVLNRLVRLVGLYQLSHLDRLRPQC